jgi:hypothetical protein
MQKIARKPGVRTQRAACVFRFFLGASALLALFLLVTPCLVRAQLATADILGTVTDSTGAVIPDAKVTILDTGTGISNTQKSNKTGEFLFSHVQIGTFKVTVEAKGFKTFTTTGLKAGTGDRVRVNAKLEVGSEVETVEVEASAAAELQTDSSDISSLIPSTSMSEMPTNGRNYYDLLALQAGTTSSSGGSDPTDERPVMAFAANGQNSEFNNNMTDGMDNNERSLGEVGLEPSLDALQEVKVETNMYSAEYSRTGGGIANLITKSGTNKFHGTAFEFMRNDDFDAYPWEPAGTAKTKAELRQNQFGGSLGGPIMKNKAFFFGDYQGWRQIKGAPATAWVPNSSEYESVHAYPASGSITLNDQWAYGGTATSITLSPNQINALGLAYMMDYPKPTCETCLSYNWAGLDNTSQSADTYDGRIDYHLSDKNTIFGRYSYNKTSTTEPGTFPATPIVSGNTHTYWSGANLNPVIAQNLALDYVHIYSPSTLFEAKASFLRTNLSEKSPNDAYWTVAGLAIPCTTDFCYDTAGVYGLPQWSFSSANPGTTYFGATAPYAGGGDGGELGYVENSFQYNASLTMNRGAHSIKMGATLIRRQVEAPTSSTTDVGFAANYTANALADMLEGESVSVGGRVVMVIPRFRMWEPSAYIQDDWRATKSLTLNLGVRYDIYTPWTDRYGHISNFDLNTDLIVSPDLLGANSASPTANVKTDFGDISPRFGFAYSLPHSMVIRGGWGLSYFPANTNGRGEFEMTNTPFIWSIGCGVSGYQTNGCSSSSYNAAELSDGGYNLSYELPRASYSDSLALVETPSNYYTIGNGNGYIMPNFKPSYLEQFNLQLQKQMGNNIFTAGFVGNLGRRQPTSQNLNDPNEPISAGGVYPLVTASTQYMSGVYVGEAMSAVNTDWLAGEATYERRLTHGLSANVNYTWSRSEGESNGASECVYNGCPMDNGQGGVTLINGWKQYNWNGSTSHRAAGMVTYNLPFGKSLHGVAGAVVSGWALNGTGWWQTGAWNSVTSGVNQSGMGSFAKMGTEYPDKIAGVSTKLHHPTLNEWFNISAFALQTANTLGNARLNLIEGPRSRNADLGLGKIFSLAEGFKLQFRAEAFNLTNTPNYDPPPPPGGGMGGGEYSISSFNDAGVATSSGGFGSITSVANDPRVFQFGLKLIY